MADSVLMPYDLLAIDDLCKPNQDQQSHACNCGQAVPDSCDPQLQDYFASQMREKAQQQGHRSVAVLLLSWDYGDMDTHNEVRELHEVFDQDYGYRVHEAWIKKNTTEEKNGRAIHQMSAFVSNFLKAEDTTNSLLIIYYAGHGMKAMVEEHEQFVLHDGEEFKSTKQRNQIVWDRMEQPLRSDTQADVLLIFDCCYAGLLGATRASSFDKRIFEYICATSRYQTARGPGDDSFTSALIWALKKFANCPDLREFSRRNGGFTVAQLLEEVRQAPYFKDTKQWPSDGHRSIGNAANTSTKRLKIMPLREKPSEVKEEEPILPSLNGGVIQHSLHLHFQWDQVPREEHIEGLVDNLWTLIEDRDLPIRNVVWGMLSNESKRIEGVAMRAIRQWRRSISRKSFSSQAPIKTSTDEAVRLSLTPENTVTDQDSIATLVDEEEEGGGKTRDHSESNTDHNIRWWTSLYKFPHVQVRRSHYYQIAGIWFTIGVAFMYAMKDIWF